jgi:hypothetical protein
MIVGPEGDEGGGVLLFELEELELAVVFFVAEAALLEPLFTLAALFL